MASLPEGIDLTAGIDLAMLRKQMEDGKKLWGEELLGLANAARTKSNSIRARSNCVRFSFETDMSHLNCHFRLLNTRRRQACLFSS
jgi:hypothetical protein